MSAEKLEVLNKYRVAEGKEPFKDWRKARHEPMLAAYETEASKADEEQARADAEHAERKRIEQEKADRIAAEERALEEKASKGKGERKGNKREKTEGEKQIKDAIENNDFGGVGEKFKGVKLPSYKEMANYSDSTVQKPVAFVHQFLSDNDMLSRKEAVAALMEYGVNYSTARTQYQRWFSERKKAKG